MGDGDKLARAFGNLLKNAINYSYLNTTIKIDIKEYEDKIEIVFKNKGDKIPEYKLEKYLINSIEQMNQEHLAQGEQD